VGANVVKRGKADIVLNVPASTEDELDDTRSGLCAEVESAFHEFLEHSLEMSCAHFNTTLN
jgi:hypothetical protein